MLEVAPAIASTGSSSGTTIDGGGVAPLAGAGTRVRYGNR
jgi:hypothetical protein